MSRLRMHVHSATRLREEEGSAMSEAKTICQEHARNLDTLKRAFRRGNVALVECKRVADGEVVAMLCTVWKNPASNEIEIVPFAEMVNGNPFEMYLPPKPGGGFAETREEATR